jgi:hypothetical protein
MLTTAKYYTFLTLKDVGANQTIVELLPGHLLFRIFDTEFGGQLGPDEDSGVLKDVFPDKAELAGLPVGGGLVVFLGVLEHRQGQVPARGGVAGLLPELLEDRILGQAELGQLNLSGQHSLSLPIPSSFFFLLPTEAEHLQNVNKMSSTIS